MAEVPLLANIGSLQPLFLQRNNCTPEFLLKIRAAAYSKKKGIKIKNQYSSLKFQFHT
jgi:hypothetical protein